jgi:hypothetical protein
MGMWFMRDSQPGTPPRAIGPRAALDVRPPTYAGLRGPAEAAPACAA